MKSIIEKAITFILFIVALFKIEPIIYATSSPAVPEVCEISTTALPDATSCIMGDSNGDGNVSAADARTILRVSVGLDTIASVKIVFCDCDYDGNITASDARLALRTAVGLEENVIHHFTFSSFDESSCSDSGSYIARCSDCGLEITGYLPKKEHSYDDGTVIKVPLKNTDGILLFTCRKCGNSYEKNISYCESDDVLSQGKYSEFFCSSVNSDSISQNFKSISDDCGARWYSYNANDKAYNKIISQLMEYGFSGNALITDRFYVDDILCKNIYAKVTTKKENPDIIVFCAHYDSVKAGKGAIDNATGIATLLETARIFSEAKMDYGAEIRFCFLCGEEIGYCGAYRYCWYVSQSTSNSPASIGRHRYVLNLDMTGHPSNDTDYYLCVSTEPIADTWSYRKAKDNATSEAVCKAKETMGSCGEKEFYCPVSAGKHDLLPFRKYGVDGATLSWREKDISDNACDYNLVPPVIIHTSFDTIENTDINSLILTTRLVVRTLTKIVYNYR